MKYLIMEENKEPNGGGAPADKMTKTLEDGFKALREQFGELSAKLEAKTQPAPKAPAKEEPEEDLSDLILTDPTKAVNKIKKQVREEVLSSVQSTNVARDTFQTKFVELQAEFPEIGKAGSELHKRAKEILAASGSQQYDAGALENAVLRAASEKGVLPLKHRKQEMVEDDDNEQEYVGGSSGGREAGGRSGGRRSRSDKIDPRTLAFAEMIGMDVKDPKVVERLTKRQNERQGTWNKYK
jgi:hypothetical protein